MTRPEALRVKIFADGADRTEIRDLAANPLIHGFTTNPTLMRAAGVKDYEAFAHDVLDIVRDRPVSFEVFSDEWDEIERQALEIASWAENVYVKIPVTNTRAEPADAVLRRLVARGVKVNVTAVMTQAQVRAVAACLADGPPSCISLFAGRIADTGRDPVPEVAAALEAIRPHPSIELVWASPRELLNVVQADAIGCHIITVTRDLLTKLPLLGRALDRFSLETVRMFHDDARAAGYAIRTGSASTEALAR
jgi:transaldolase